MSEESRTDPTELDDAALTHRSEHELDQIEATVDEAERDVRIGDEEGDDLPTSPPEALPRASEREMAGIQGEETIEERIAQEEPDPTTAYGAPDDEGGLDARRDRDDDDLSIDPADDFVGSTDPLEPTDEGYAGFAAEESAMHVSDSGLDDGEATR